MDVVKRLFDSVYHILFLYPAPLNLSYLWNFGVYSIVALFIQIISGILLAMHYVSDIAYAFSSVEHIMRDVSFGWFLRYIHSNGASIFFIVVYVHIFRGLYYGSFMYPRFLLWVVGCSILLLMIVTAFLGYVLPWGQMSFWAATVITNLFSAFPIIGFDIVTWLWGGYSVGGPTLTKFFSLHYFFPFFIFFLVVLHILLLHLDGSNNPIGIKLISEYIAFFPYFSIKDLFGLLFYFFFFFNFILILPNELGHSDNYIEANPMVTPSHIVPEWYFLPFYAILRAVPDKFAGVLSLFLAIASLFLVPFFLRSNVRVVAFRPVSKFSFWYFAFLCLQLGWFGSTVASFPFVEMSQTFTFLYFSFFIKLSRLVAFFEEGFQNILFFIKFNYGDVVTY